MSDEELQAQSDSFFEAEVQKRRMKLVQSLNSTYRVETLWL